MKTINNSKHIALIAVATLGAAVFTVGAHAADDAPAAQTRVVKYSDLNLNTAAGAEVLYRRIRGAAEIVCGDVDSRRLEVAMAAKACVNRAIVASVHSVNSVQLTRAANAHGYEVQTSYSVASMQ